jgi:hypothetical protein
MWPNLIFMICDSTDCTFKIQSCINGKELYSIPQKKRYFYKYNQYKNKLLEYEQFEDNRKLNIYSIWNNKLNKSFPITNDDFVDIDWYMFAITKCLSH